jgi:undecaprenyl-diphosphatase
MNREQLTAHDKVLSRRLALWANGRFRHTLAWFLARTGDGAFWFLVIAILFWQKRRLGWELLLAALATAVIVAILKSIFRRQRPKAKRAFATDKYSFPSGHAARATAVAVTLSFYNPLLTPFWLTWAVLVSLARVALSRHFLSDVAGGLIVGLLAGFGLQMLIS